MVLREKLWWCIKLINISYRLHFLGFNFIRCSIAKVWMSFTAIWSRLIPFLGSISRAVVSSTNFILRCQSLRRLFVIIANRITPNLVPWGIPPLRGIQCDRESPILTACILLVRKALIQLINTGCIPRFASPLRRMLWSIKSNPLEKSAKNNACRNSQCQLLCG